MAVRLGHLQLAALRQRLSERDLDIIASVREHRFLTTGQIRRLHFADHATLGAGTRASIRVLLRLKGLRLLTRLERQIGGIRAGSAAYVWCLDIYGDRLSRPGPTRTRYLDPSTTFLTHSLGVAETHVRLVEAARAGQFELLRVQIEQDSWRHHLGAGGETTWLKPDLAVVTAQGDYEDHWFIEYDLGHESLRTLIRKCAAYDRYRRTGREQAASGVFPRVLWLLPTPRRIAALNEALTAEPGLDRQPFLATTPDRLIDVIAHGDG